MKEISQCGLCSNQETEIAEEGYSVSYCFFDLAPYPNASSCKRFQEKAKEQKELHDETTP